MSFPLDNTVTLYNKEATPHRIFYILSSGGLGLVIDWPDCVALVNNGYFYEGRKSLFPEVLIMEAY